MIVLLIRELSKTRSNLRRNGAVREKRADAVSFGRIGWLEVCIIIRQNGSGWVGLLSSTS